jgi:hypothetical protein
VANSKRKKSNLIRHQGYANLKLHSDAIKITEIRLATLNTGKNWGPMDHWWEYEGTYQVRESDLVSP